MDIQKLVTRYTLVVRYDNTLLSVTNNVMSLSDMSVRGIPGIPGIIICKIIN